MIKEAWESFKDNIKERVTNPFLGTFVLVWIVKNWKIVYAFFFFDKEWKLQSKIDYFNAYWKEHNFFWNLVFVAFVTIALLILTYFFLAISRFFSNTFENVVIPNIQKISKGKIVTAETHQAVLDKIATLEGKFEAERKAKNDVISERDELEKKFYRTDKNNDVDYIPKENISNKAEINKPVLTANYNAVIEEGLSLFKYKDIEETLMDLDKGYLFGGENKIIDFLLRYDLIELQERSNYEEIYYKYTMNGKIFRRQFLDIKEPLK